MEPAHPASDTSLGPLLLQMARESLEETIGGVTRERPSRLSDDSRLDVARGCFVSLHTEGRLRGCIGQIEARRPLRSAVPDLALAAARSDPRFPPVEAEELGDLEVEVSVLTPPVPFDVASRAEAEQRLHPGLDGVVVHWRGHQGTFLPQVWDQLREPSRFLDELWRKARIPPGVWDDDLRLETYRVERWSEP